VADAAATNASVREVDPTTATTETAIGQEGAEGGKHREQTITGQGHRTGPTCDLGQVRRRAGVDGRPAEPLTELGRFRVVLTVPNLPRTLGLGLGGRRHAPILANVCSL